MMANWIKFVKPYAINNKLLKEHPNDPDIKKTVADDKNFLEYMEYVLNAKFLRKMKSENEL